MKRIRTLFAFALTLVMVFAIALPTAFAGSITINRDNTYAGSNGRTYTAYKVFDADTTVDNINDKTTPVAYYMDKNSPWKTAMLSNDQEWFSVDLTADGSKYVVTQKKELSDSDAVEIASYLDDNLPNNYSGTTIDPGTTVNVDNGYYLIKASDGATTLTLVTANVDINEKNQYITTTKSTVETSYNVGDIVEYTAEVFIPADASRDGNVVLHDEMNNVLEFKNDSVSAQIDTQAFEDYQLKTEGLSDNCTFEISIPVTEAVLGKTITFTYSAELTSDAVDSDFGFVNKLYGEKNGYTTEPNSPKVYTFDFEFKKTFDGDASTSLTAVFELRTNKDDPDSAIALKTIDGGYIKADSDDNNAVTQFTMTNGVVKEFKGFKADKYYLVETSTSTGYNKLDEAYEFEIKDTSNPQNISHTVTKTNASGQIEIQNNKGTVMPSTGGIGTTIFYVVGGVLVVGAVLFLLTKRRAAAE